MEKKAGVFFKIKSTWLVQESITRELQKPMQLPTKNHRKSMRARLTLTHQIPTRACNQRPGIESRMTWNLLTAVWEYFFRLYICS